MKNRLKELRNELNLTQQEFADRIGLTRNAVGNYETGNRTPLDTIIKSICREFDVSEMWLREGMGPMFRPPIALDNEMMILATQLTGTDDEFSKIVISQYLRLSPESKKTVKELILSIAKQYSDTKKDGSEIEPSTDDNSLK